MADTLGPSAALLGRPAAVAKGHDLDAPVGCLAPGDRNQAAAHPARGVTGADPVGGDRQQTVTIVPGVAAPERCPARGVCVAWPAWQGTGIGCDGTGPRWPG